jgi:hypothetical protein
MIVLRTAHLYAPYRVKSHSKPPFCSIKIHFTLLGHLHIRLGLQFRFPGKVRRTYEGISIISGTDTAMDTVVVPIQCKGRYSTRISRESVYKISHNWEDMLIFLCPFIWGCVTGMMQLRDGHDNGTSNFVQISEIMQWRTCK